MSFPLHTKAQVTTAVLTQELAFRGVIQPRGMPTMQAEGSGENVAVSLNLSAAVTNSSSIEICEPSLHIQQ